MNKFDASKKLSKVINAHRKYMSSLKELEQSIKPMCEFDASIEWQPADGFVICDEEANVAPIADCLSVMYTKRNLSSEDFLRLCI